MAGSQPWSSGLISFLAIICRSSAEDWTDIWRARMTYVAYQIRLFKNSLVFDAEIMSTHRILERAISLATKYYHFNTTSLSINTLGLSCYIYGETEGSFYLLKIPTAWICKGQLWLQCTRWQGWCELCHPRSECQALG